MTLQARLTRIARQVGAELYATPEDEAEAMAAAVIDGLRDGYAIVELPEPSYIDDPEDDVKGYGFNGGPGTALTEHGVYAYGTLVFDQYDGWTPEQARTIASWWLAAADAAERV